MKPTGTKKSSTPSGHGSNSNGQHEMNYFIAPTKMKTGPKNTKNS